MDTTSSSTTNRTARDRKRASSPLGKSRPGTPIPRKDADSWWEVFVTQRQTDRWRGPSKGSKFSGSYFLRAYFFFRRLLSITRPPERRARALTAEVASISGAGRVCAIAVVAMATSNNVTPTTFISYFLLKFEVCSYFFRRLLSISRLPES